MGDKKVSWLSLAQPCNLRWENSFLVSLGSSHICAFLANLCSKVSESAGMPHKMICLEFNQRPTKWDYLPCPWKTLTLKYLKVIKIQIMRALPFTIGFLGFMYFDTHTSLFPRSEVKHFPGSDMLAERGRKMAGPVLVF